MAALVLLCYWPVLHGALLWDDPAHVTRADLRSASGLWRIWAELGATQQYYPVLHSAFWLEHRLWGDATLGYHLLNVLLHATSCCLLALLLRCLWDANWRPAGGASGPRATVPAGTEWIVALIFAVHPVCTESVAWISEQKNTLSLCLYLLAAMAYVRFIEQRQWRAYALASGLFLLAIGTKTVTATLPAALLVVLWWKQGRLAWRRDVVPLLPWFGAGLVAGLFTAWVERKLIGAEGAAFELSLVERVLLAGRVVWFYVGKLVWPADLAFFYPRWNVSAAALGWLGYLGAALAVTVGLWLNRRRTPGLLAGWLLFGGSLFPALGFFNVYPFAFSYVADHFQYHAGVSFLATTIAALAVLSRRLAAWGPKAGALLAAGVILLFSLHTARESRLYVNDETLFNATLARTPDCWIAHQILGVTYGKMPGRSADAIRHYEAVIRLNPEHPDAYHGLGVEFAKQPGRRDEVIQLYRKSIELRPTFIEAHNNLGVELSMDPATFAEAVAHFETVLELRPGHPNAHVNLAQTLARMPGRRDDAIRHYETALQLRPDDVRAHNGLAYLLAQIPGRLPEAIAHGEAAVAASPRDPQAHYQLANALAVRPEGAAEAIRHYEIALELEPQLAPAHYGLANTLVHLPGRSAEAVTHYERALALDPGFLEAHINLANLLTSIEPRREEAIAHYEAALRLNPNLPWVHHNLALVLAQDPAQARAAMQHCEEALRLNPDYLDAMNSLGILYAQQGDTAQARAVWQRALQKDPAFAPARQNLQLLDQQTAR
ncbi:tetratricopeptide repeat protein [Opitutus terrae]|uniref:tetratricopeptide repeat protein n=1 Tax=Opitutus terrae TaxID=107709 RepID=UPI0006943796|nr:tetratricopeptide repeat protein [Opitutus terrae]